MSNGAAAAAAAAEQQQQQQQATASQSTEEEEEAAEERASWSLERQTGGWVGGCRGGDNRKPCAALLALTAWLAAAA